MKLATGNLFLVGLMGSGKSTVGRHLAQRLDKRFVDADRELEARTGVKVSVIFEIEGEAGFRRREAELLRELTDQRNIVLATGGGAVKDAATRELLKSRGFTVYLAATAAELYTRTRQDKSRPLLNTADPKERLQELLAERDAWYREVADLVFDTGRPNVSRLANAIVDALQSHPGFAAAPCVAPGGSPS